MYHFILSLAYSLFLLTIIVSHLHAAKQLVIFRSAAVIIVQRHTLHDQVQLYHFFV